MRRGITSAAAVFLFGLLAAAQASAATVNVASLNVRTGPGFNFHIVGVLARGTVVHVVKTSGLWSEISSPKTGWVFSAYLSASSVPTLKVALTFDDGPDTKPAFAADNTTRRVRAFLAANGIHATFFVEHSRINTANGAAQIRAAAVAGHQVGVHGANPHLHHQSYALTTGLLAQFLDMRRIIQSATGKPPLFARPPGGEATLAANIAKGWVGSSAIQGPHPVPRGVTVATINAAVRAAGMTDYLGDGTDRADSWLTQMWPGGWYFPGSRTGPVVTAVARKMDQAVAGRTTTRAIILCHDIGGTASYVLANLQSYVNELRRLAKAKGVRLVFGTFSEVTR